MSKLQVKRALTMAIALVALSPTWYALAFARPEVWWQSLTTGCVQTFFGALAIAAIGLLHEA